MVDLIFLPNLISGIVLIFHARSSYPFVVRMAFLGNDYEQFVLLHMDRTICYLHRMFFTLTLPGK